MTITVGNNILKELFLFVRNLNVSDEMALPALEMTPPYVPAL
jgi:hypothetical protein